MALPNQQTVNDLCFNLVIVGDRGTGKTTLLNSHLTGGLAMTYQPYVGADVYPLDFFTNRGKIRFYCYETADRDRFGPVPVFCDKEIPIVVCGNKVDLKDRRHVKHTQVTYLSKKNLQFYEISAKSKYNFEKPFLYLARKLIRDADLHFVESPALFPPQVQIDLAAQAQNEAELVDAASQPLPDDDGRFE